MKPDMKLREEDTDAVIKYKKRCILALKYIGKSFDGLRCNFDEYRDVQKKIAITLVRIVKIIEQMVNRLYFIFCFAVNSFRRIKKLCLFIIRFSNKLI